jgi:hypothetical protein
MSRLEKIIDELQNSSNFPQDKSSTGHQTFQSKVLDGMREILAGIKTSFLNAASGARIIEYFIHNMIDYASLTESNSSFLPIISDFRVDSAI